jgi:hypothetical protein
VDARQSTLVVVGGDQINLNINMTIFLSMGEHVLVSHIHISDLLHLFIPFFENQDIVLSVILLSLLVIVFLQLQADV